MDYQARRQRLAQSLPPDTIAFIPAAMPVIRNGDSHYRFRQSSDFHYLTGFNESDAVLCITSGERGESVLFCRENDPAEAQWVGARLGVQAAKAALLVDVAYPIDALAARLPELFLDKKTVYYPMGGAIKHEMTLRNAWQAARRHAKKHQSAPELFGNLSPLLGELRLIKSASEINSLREAAAVSVVAHECVMRAASKARHEYELEAEFVYALGKAGCREMAYDPIVAGGARACTLHYTANNQPFSERELLLIDAGGEVDHYASDITRTYPVNGRFTTEQRLIYELVWEAQKAGIDCVKPGKPWDSIQEAVVKTLTTGLVSLGLLKGDVDHLIEQGAYKPFYMHSAGHWLGLDVHDAGNYQMDDASRPLAPGMALTVEPGLYIAADCEIVDKKWRGIGVRIEDDFVVTKTGHEQLTKALCVSPDDLEQIVRDA